MKRAQVASGYFFFQWTGHTLTCRLFADFLDIEQLKFALFSGMLSGSPNDGSQYASGGFLPDIGVVL